jgi:TolB-like protein
MKRCPQCNRVETDEALKFCRVDGATLVSDSSAIGSDSGTAQLGSLSDASEVHTSILPHKTDADMSRATGPTTALPAQPAPSATNEPSKPKSRRSAIVIAAIATAVVAATSAILVDSYRSRKSNGAAIQSIAVLPFENKNSDADTDYLSDGLADSLIFHLSQLPGLKVSPATSVMRYKGKDNDLAKVASELGVEAIMTGRLLKRGDNLNITVELIDVRNNKSLWGEQYERKMSDLLQTQREIASAITQKLQLKLSGEGEQKLAKKYTDNNEAYQLYLKGRYYWNKRTPENMRKAIEQFKEAAEKDPNYALAYVGLADCYAVLPFYGTPSHEVLPQAKAYANRALEIDDSLSEVHTSLAFINTSLWNWAEAEKG